jgi:hypothetical protein
MQQIRLGGDIGMEVIKGETDVKERIKAAFESSQIPKTYANGFMIFVGQADVGVIFQNNGADTVVLNMSFTLAKTLVEKLGITMNDFEQKTGTTIMTTDTVRQKTLQDDSNEIDL